MKTIFRLAVVLVLGAAYGADLRSVWGPRASFEVTFRCNDDLGRPIEAARIGCSWGRLGFKAPDVGQADVLTDAQGKAVIFAQSVFNEFNYHCEKAGFYSTRSAGYDRPIFRERVGGRWEPWNPTIELVLKPIRNPVPMFARKVELKIPEFGIPIGYDLMAGDWTAPYGVGERADFIFEAKRSVRSDRDYEGKLALRFSNRADGLIAADMPLEDGSELRLPYDAPADGYVAQKIWGEERRPMPDGRDVVHSDSLQTMNYFFRVRSVVDAEGRVVSALYGKIHGDIRFFIGTKAPRSGLAFTYYLNPDGTRNVEFDPKRNLFKSAKPGDSAFWNLGP